MKLLKVTIAFITLISLQITAAQWINVPPPVEARNLMMVGGGVPIPQGACSNGTWIYPIGRLSTDFTQTESSTDAYALGGKVQTTGAGTATYIGVLLDDAGSARNLKVSLQLAADPYTLVDGGNATGATNGSNLAEWQDIAINASVAATTAYQVMFHADSTAFTWYYVDTGAGVAGYYREEAYSAFPNSSGGNDDSVVHAVRICVVP